MDKNRRATTELRSRLRRDYFGLWIAIALILSTLGLTRLAVEVDETMPIVGEGPGHGNYCRIPERGVYFYGRDFDETVDTYERMAEWCRQNDGILGWAE